MKFPLLTFLALIAGNVPVLTDNNYESNILCAEVSVAVDILTTANFCSEEGLEDCTDILLALSRAQLSLRIQVLRELLNGKTFFFRMTLRKLFVKIRTNYCGLRL